MIKLFFQIFLICFAFYIGGSSKEMDWNDWDNVGVKVFHHSGEQPSTPTFQTRPELNIKYKILIAYAGYNVTSQQSMIWTQALFNFLSSTGSTFSFLLKINSFLSLSFNSFFMYISPHFIHFYFQTEIIR